MPASAESGLCELTWRACHPGDMRWSQQILVSGIDSPYVVHCEPEGAEHEVLPGDVLTFTFSGDRPHGFEMSYVADGMLLCKLGDSNVTIDDKRGRTLVW